MFKRIVQKKKLVTSTELERKKILKKEVITNEMNFKHIELGKAHSQDLLGAIYFLISFIGTKHFWWDI